MMPSDLQKTLHELGIEVPICRKILVVDDEEENLDVIAALLEDTWDVSTAENGRAALELLAESGPVDLVISDQRMPEMTGVELLQRVAQQSPDTVRVVLTGYSDVEPMVQAINKGSVYRFLLKPFDAAELLTVVEEGLALKTSALTLRRLVQALAERRRALEQTLRRLHEAQEQLVAAERMSTIGQLASGVAHDLRNQASALSGLIEITKEVSKDEHILGAANKAWADLNLSLQLLTHIQDYVRSSSHELVAESVDTHQFLTDTVEVFKTQPHGNRCPVEISLSSAALAVHVGRTHLEHAILELLSNAARASTPGVPITLSLSQAEDGWVLIQVQDQGCGMEESTLERATEPFFSAFRPPGIGMGLEIARLGVQAHHGRLELDSSPGVGTHAHIALPPLTAETLTNG